MQAQYQISSNIIETSDYMCRYRQIDKILPTLIEIMYEQNIDFEIVEIGTWKQYVIINIYYDDNNRESVVRFMNAITYQLKEEFYITTIKGVI